MNQELKPVLYKKTGNEPCVPLPKALFPGLKAPIILRTRGNGMKNAGIHDGDYLVFETDISVQDGDIVVALINGEEVCRRLFLMDERIIVLREDGVTPPFYADTCEIHGVLKHVIHKSSANRIN